MQTLRQLLDDRGLFPSLRALEPASPWREVAGLDGSAPAVAVALRHLARGEGARTLVVAEDARGMERLRDDLGALLGDEAVLPFPGLEVKPYEWRKPFGAALESRLVTLEALAKPGPRLVVTTLSAFGQRLSEPGRLARETLTLQKGGEADLARIRRRLGEMGYREEPLCEEMGAFSVRGGILDVFGLGMDNPVRAELWGDEIESLREFDLFTQRSLGDRAEAEILPLDEGLPGEEALQEGLLALLEAFPGEDRRFEAERSRLEDEGDRTGWAWQRPFFARLDWSLLDHLGDGVECFLFSPPPQEAQETLLDNARSACAKALQTGHLVAPAEAVWFPGEELAARVAAVPSLRFTAFLSDRPGSVRVECRVQERTGSGIGEAGARIRELAKAGDRVHLLSVNQGQANRLSEIVEDLPVAGIVVGHLAAGFHLPQDGQAWWTDHQIFHRFARRVRRVKGRSGAALPDIESLQKGDFVVHETYGIGKYLGIERIRAGNQDVDVLVLQYEGKDRLRVSISDLAKIQKWGSRDAEPPQLHKLGGKTWDVLQEKTRKAVEEMVKELVELYAKRSVAVREAFPPDDHFQTEFEDAFPWDLTADQARAVEECKIDLQGERPMDRLVCGDVGFGKTEVAVRSVFKSVMARRQVAFLAPTTLLASQHAATLQDRFADWPIRVELMNRFVPAKEQKRILQDTKDGKVDVLVGTHRILAKDVEFRHLGLMVLDEEQKFGVKQKERLKEMRHEVDVLTLTATPIPRTLHMSLAGARDVSIIATPPRNRLPVGTRVRNFSEERLGEALRDELERGGQAFVVSPRIEGLEAIARTIEENVPQARVCVGHGQMGEDELEQVMGAFLAREFDILVSTTIVESGLDIPSVNTICVIDAHKFGLSQLHQLRGRVGRSDIHAFCELFVPDLEKLPQDAKRRLQALEQFTDLGSGYAIAMRDLEIRGAGNLLGHKQHGFAHAVGFETYCRILKEAVDQLAGTEKARVPLEPRIELDGDAFLPESYIEDSHVRIQLYQRIARLTRTAEIDAMGAELRDRFGPVPETAALVLRMAAARIAARDAGVAVGGIARGRMILEFDEAWRPSLEELKERANGLRPKIEWLSMAQPLRMVADLTGYPGVRGQDEFLAILRKLAGEKPA
ncbi:MAG: transcription-repair coupling factor [Fibrobacteria bacterium]|nr:transcription-repair coupling factor [Fibrobacteria bacterium]